MTPDEAIAVVDRTTLKPGYRVDLRESEEENLLELSIAFTQDDAQAPERGPRPWAWTTYVSAGVLQKLNEEALLKRILLTVVRNDVHEAMEWLKVDGATVFDPHSLGEPELTLEFGHWFE